MIKTGARVRWTSQSQGYETTKEGIAYLVPKGEDPFIVAFDVLNFDRDRTQVMFDGTQPRNHDSFLVVVDRGPGRKKAVYWPRVSLLVEVQPSKASTRQDDLLVELKAIMRQKPTSQKRGGKHPNRWMPAVLIRKATLREVIERLEAKPVLEYRNALERK